MAKRRANGEGSICKRKSDGKWIAVVSYRDATGKRRRKTRVARSREHARLLLQEMQTETAPAASTLRLHELLDTWLRNVVTPSLSDNTASSYGYAIRNHISSRIGRYRISELTSFQIQEWLVAMQSCNVGSRTQQNAFSVLTFALNHAVQLGLIPANPCLRVQRPKHTPEEIFPFELDEVRKILDTTKGDRLYVVHALGLTTGMRQGEIFGLRWEDVDVDEGVLRVRQQATEVDGRIHIGPPKTRQSRRTIRVAPVALDALKRRAEAARRERESEFVIPNTIGGPIRRSLFGRRKWTPLLNHLNFKHRGFHHCRHTAATLMLQAGVPVRTVANYLGHARASVTLDTYSHVLQQDDKAVVEAVRRLIC